ncbi:MAG: hypothetical protein K0R90_380 [Oscillospiraceae bacterium]|jgi:fluoroquinolone transport system permease protein|nr:hypothetical protein [Oscillospiraceae bacterium]
MKIKALLTGDIRFQFKYGFYFLYLIFSLLYVGLLFTLPASWREKAALLMIFSDPAVMGLFFMGAIVLFEKSEKVLDSIAISPVTPFKYTVSKLISIAVISLLVALAIGISGGIVTNLFYFLTGILLCSCLFSSIGLITAFHITSLNGFILATIPTEIFASVPVAAYLFGWNQRWFLVHPGVCLVELCRNGENALPALFILTLWTVLSAALACKTVKKSLQSLGGVKL